MQWRMEKVERAEMEARVSEVKEKAPETEKSELTLEDKSWLGEPHHVSDLELEDDGFLLSSLGCRILTVDGDDEKEADKSRKPKKTMKRAKYKGKHSTTRPRPPPPKSSQCSSSTDSRSCPSSRQQREKAPEA